MKQFKERRPGALITCMKVFPLLLVTACGGSVVMPSANAARGVDGAAANPIHFFGWQIRSEDGQIHESARSLGNQERDVIKALTKSDVKDDSSTHTALRKLSSELVSSAASQSHVLRQQGQLKQTEADAQTQVIRSLGTTTTNTLLNCLEMRKVFTEQAQSSLEMDAKTKAEWAKWGLESNGTTHEGAGGQLTRGFLTIDLKSKRVRLYLFEEYSGASVDELVEIVIQCQLPKS